jgi:hypothetical protein
VAFRSPNALLRERILSFGGSGLGKSFDFYCIINRALKTKSDAHFHIVDTDNSAIRMMVDPMFEGRMFQADGSLHPQIHVYEAGDYQALVQAMDAIHKVVKPQDWTMIDMVTPSWEWAQNEFCIRTYGKSLEEYWVERRKAVIANDKKGGYGAFEGIDWQAVKVIFSSFSEKVVAWPSNLYATAEVKAINSDRADRDTRLMFGPHGVVPVGQARMPHWFQTILWKTATRPDTYEIITIKDRSRVKLQGAPITDFSRDYLITVAGWKAL